MALDKPKSSMVVKLAMLYEVYLGSWASAHLTVTKAMGALLKQEWGVKGMVVTLYDRCAARLTRRPPKHFKVLTAAERLYVGCCFSLLVSVAFGFQGQGGGKDEESADIGNAVHQLRSLAKDEQAKDSAACAADFVNVLDCR